MNKIINADSFIASLLKKREQISFEELQRIKKKVEKELPGVVIDISSPSIESALYYYPNLFKRSGSFIMKQDNSINNYNSDLVDKMLISQIPNNIKKKITFS
jgi:hypothetical protein